MVESERESGRQREGIQKACTRWEIKKFQKNSASREKSRTSPMGRIEPPKMTRGKKS
jgi:hypothetical protein